MPCNAIVYLPATIEQLDTTAIFANQTTANLTTRMLEASLAATLRHNNIGACYYDQAELGSANITVNLAEGTMRIWQDGRVVIRLQAGTRDPESVNAAIWEAIKATLASLTQILTAQAISAAVQVTDTQFVGNNLVLTVNL